MSARHDRRVPPRGGRSRQVSTARSRRPDQGRRDEPVSFDAESRAASSTGRRRTLPQTVRRPRRALADLARARARLRPGTSCRDRRRRHCTASTGHAATPFHVTVYAVATCSAPARVHTTPSSADRRDDGRRAAGDVGDADAASTWRGSSSAGDADGGARPALRDGLTTEDAAAATDRRRCDRRGATASQAAGRDRGLRGERGGHSWLERRYLELCAAAGLPRLKTQQVLAVASDRLVRVDIRYAETAVVVELLGYRWHRTREQMAATSSALNAWCSTGSSRCSSRTTRWTPTGRRARQMRAALGRCDPALCHRTRPGDGAVTQNEPGGRSGWVGDSALLGSPAVPSTGAYLIIGAVAGVDDVPPDAARRAAGPAGGAGCTSRTTAPSTPSRSRRSAGWRCTAGSSSPSPWPG